MANYKANFSFDDDRLGKVKRDQPLNITEQQAKPYERAGLIRSVVVSGGIVNEQNPISAAGTVQSASPAAQASPPTIATKPKRGRKQKAEGQSSL